MDVTSFPTFVFEFRHGETHFQFAIPASSEADAKDTLKMVLEQMLDEPTQAIYHREGA